MWKDIDPYKGSYQVSNTGKVFSHKVGRLLKQQYSKKMYLNVTLTGPKSTKNTLKIHRLVAEAFIRNPNNKPQVNHIDGNKENNNSSNLEWVTNQENQDHAWAMGRDRVKGERQWASKLSEKSVVTIRAKYRTGKYTYLDLAKKYNVKMCTIADVITGKSWAHV